MAHKKGKGYLFKRGGYYYVRVKVNGKDIVKSLKTGDERLAKQRYKDFVQSIVPFDTVATLNSLKSQIELEGQRRERTERIEVKEMLNKYFSSPFCSKMTRDTATNYISMVNHFIRFFKKSAYMCDVTAKDALDFVSRMKSVLVDERLFGTVCCLRRIWDVCMKYDNNIRLNVWESLGLKFHKDKKRKRRELTSEEIQRLLIAADREEFKKYWHGEVRMLFEIGAFTALRLMDCVNLRWCEVGDDIIKKVPRKTAEDGIEAVIPICDRLRGVLGNWKYSGNSSDDYVLPILSSLHRRKINKLVHRVFAAAGIAICEVGRDGKKTIKTGFHSLRVSALSSFLRICGDINVVKTIAAHKNADMTLWYTHCQERDVLRAFKNCAGEEPRISAETNNLILGLKREGETVDAFIRRLIAGGAKPAGALDAIEVQNFNISA